MGTFGFIAAFLTALILPRAMFALAVGILSGWPALAVAPLVALGAAMDWSAL